MIEMTVIRENAEGEEEEIEIWVDACYEPEERGSLEHPYKSGGYGSAYAEIEIDGVRQDFELTEEEQQQVYSLLESRDEWNANEDAWERKRDWEERDY